jgi:hypothetical protein
MKVKIELRTIDRLPKTGELYKNEEGEYYICGSKYENDTDLGWPGEKIQTVEVHAELLESDIRAAVMEKKLKDGQITEIYPLNV